jgi:hypothetical protein
MLAFNLLFTVIFMLIWIKVIVSIIKAATRVDNKKQTNHTTVKTQSVRPARKTAVYKKDKKAQIDNALEDRHNDWLAQQLREERMASSFVNEMFQLKTEHQSNCDSSYVKNSHQRQCDANGIDTGSYK